MGPIDGANFSIRNARRAEQTAADSSVQDVSSGEPVVRSIRGLPNGVVSKGLNLTSKFHAQTLTPSHSASAAASGRTRGLVVSTITAREPLIFPWNTRIGARQSQFSSNQLCSHENPMLKHSEAIRERTINKIRVICEINPNYFFRHTV